MNRIKSLFVTAYMSSLMGTLIWALLRIWASPADPAGWGLLLAAGAPASLFVWLMAVGAARTDRNLNWIPALGTLGAGVVLWADGPGWSAVIALADGLVLPLLYNRWYSRFAQRATEALAVDARMPDIDLLDLAGQTLPSRELTQKTALWMFYRGNWCPLCMAQIREVAAQYRQLRDRGVEVYLISPQSQDHSRSLAQRFDAPMHFLTDVGNRAATALGILDKHGLPAGMQVLGYDADVPMPTVFITAPGGRIIYSDLTDNYRVRPEPAAFIAALDRAGL